MRLGLTVPEIYDMQARAIFEALSALARSGVDVVPEIMIPLVSARREEPLQALAAEVPADQERLAQERRALEFCVRTLSREERELLSRCYTEDAKVVDLATRLNRSANSIYNQLNRVRRRLLACITNRLQQGGGV